MKTTVRPADIIQKYYGNLPQAHQILLNHSRSVTKRALKIAHTLSSQREVDLQFIAEAAMLHDIGILETAVPEIGCHGSLPYLCHGIVGREILEKEGLSKHALVCERHIGIGLTAIEIKEQKLPLPERDMLPISLEEQIICYADLFFSKDPKKQQQEKSVEKVRATLNRYGADKVAVFNRWRQLFEPGAD